MNEKELSLPIGQTPIMSLNEGRFPKGTEVPLGNTGFMIKEVTNSMQYEPVETTYDDIQYVMSYHYSKPIATLADGFGDRLYIVNDDHSYVILAAVLHSRPIKQTWIGKSVLSILRTLPDPE